MSMRKIAVVLIIAGIAVIMTPLAGSLYTSYMQYQLIRDAVYQADDYAVDSVGAEEYYIGLNEVFAADGTTGSQTSDNSTTSLLPSASLLPTPSPQQILPAITPTPSSKQILLGMMKIPKIKVDVPIVEGVKPENIRFAVGHIPGTAQVGSVGNCAIAGHRNYTFGKYFNRLDELVPGDEVDISVDDRIYKYTIYKKVVVEPDDTSVLRPEGNDRILTMITCTPIYVATHRLVVYARIETPAETEGTDMKPNTEPEIESDTGEEPTTVTEKRICQR